MNEDIIVDKKENPTAHPAEVIRQTSLERNSEGFTSEELNVYFKDMPETRRAYDYGEAMRAEARKNIIATTKGVGEIEMEKIPDTVRDTRMEVGGVQENAVLQKVESTTVADSMEKPVEFSASDVVEKPVNKADAINAKRLEDVQKRMSTDYSHINDTPTDLAKKAVDHRMATGYEDIQDAAHDGPTVEIVDTEEPVVVESMKQTLKGVGENLPIEENKSSHSESIKATLKGTGEQVQQKSTLKMGGMGPEAQAEGKDRAASHEARIMDTLQIIEDRKKDIQKNQSEINEMSSIPENVRTEFQKYKIALLQNKIQGYQKFIEIQNIEISPPTPDSENKMNQLWKEWHQIHAESNNVESDAIKKNIGRFSYNQDGMQGDFEPIELDAATVEAERRKKFALDEPVELPMDTLSSVYNQKMDELDTDIVNMGRNLMEVGVMLGAGSARASEHIAKKSETENKKLDNADNPDKVKRGNFLNKEMGKIKADSIKMGNELRVLNGIQIKDRTPAHIMRMKQLELSLLRNSIMMELVTLNIKDMNGDASARKKMKEGAGKLKKTVDALKNLRVIPIQMPAQKSKSVAQGPIEYGTPYQGENKPNIVKRAWGGIKYFFTGKESGH